MIDVWFKTKLHIWPQTKSYDFSGFGLQFYASLSVGSKTLNAFPGTKIVNFLSIMHKALSLVSDVI